MLVSSETAERILLEQTSMTKRITRLQALANQGGTPELGDELSRLAGSHHELVGLVRAVLDAVTEDPESHRTLLQGFGDS